MWQSTSPVFRIVSVLSGADCGGVRSLFPGAPTDLALRIIIAYIKGKLTEPMTVSDEYEVLLRASVPVSDTETTG